MADSTVSGLNLATAPQPADLFLIVQNGESKKVPYSLLAGGLVNFTEGSGAIDLTGIGSPPYAFLAAKPIANGSGFGTGIALGVGYGGNFSAQVPTGSYLGGNRRPLYSVDMQVLRNDGTQIAGGEGSTISGGTINKTTGNYSTIGGGSGQEIYSTGSVIGGGASNRISSTSFNTSIYSTISGGQGSVIEYASPNSVISGGLTNTVNAACDQSTVSGGANNVIGCSTGTIPGGNGASTRATPGTYAWAGSSGYYGKKQTMQILTKKDSTGASGDFLTANGGTDIADSTYTLADNSTAYIRIRLLAKDKIGDGAKSWTTTALCTRGAGYATTLLRSGGTFAVDASYGTIATATANLSISSAHGGVRVQGVGIAATTITWLAHFEVLEILN